MRTALCPLPNCKDTYSTVTVLLTASVARDRPRFFDQVGHQTTNASIENKPFSSSLPKL